MSLRLRLIVAFFLFSVVPLAAVTFYSYASNERALQIAAQHEAEMLTGELTQRMQVVTTQISERVEHLMDMPESPARVAATSGRTRASGTRTASAATAAHAAPGNPAIPTTPVAPVPVTAVAALDEHAMEGQVAGALGEVAMLLNNIEVRGLGRQGGRSAAPAGDLAAGRGTIPTGTVLNEAFRGVFPRPPVMIERAASPAGRAGGRAGEDATSGRGAGVTERDGAARRGPRRGRPDGSRPEGVPADPGAPNGQRGAAPSGTPEIDPDPTHMKIDLAPIRRELFRELAPTGTVEKMTPEERQRVGREVNQRLLGIVQGFQISAAEIQKKAEAARLQASADVAAAKAGAGAPLPPLAPAVPNVPDGVAGLRGPGLQPQGPGAAARADASSDAPRRPTAPAAPRSAAPAAPMAPTVPRPTMLPPAAPPTASKPAAGPTPAPAPAAAPAPEAPAPKPMTRKAALTGNQLNVRLERNGEVVRQVNAEINLPNLLATVFANTRRDSGEIPFAVGKDGHVYAPTEPDRARLASLDVARTDNPAGVKRSDNWVVVTAPDRSGAGLKFGIARPVGELLGDLRRTTARNAGFGLLFIAIALGGIVPLSGRLTRNLSSLTAGVNRISQGDYAARVPVKSGDEIGRLAAAFNSMAADVEQHQRSAVEQERIRRELELGRRIQSEMLPRTPLHFGLTEVKGVSVPAREVGGDFFNYFALDSGLVALLVGDVSGKGVGAALLMANIQASLRTRFALGQDLSAIAEAIDWDIEANSPGPVYATLFIAIFDPATRRMRYVNAGHNPQFVRRRDGSLEKMSSTGMPVGLLAGHGYTEDQVQLAPGDLLFFYTDGCVEMENEQGEMFGTERLEPLVSASASGSADEVLAIVEQAISQFRGGRDLFDDATMMAVTVG